jgi:hypothetical protein
VSLSYRVSGTADSNSLEYTTTSKLFYNHFRIKAVWYQPIVRF